MALLAPSTPASSTLHVEVLRMQARAVWHKGRGRGRFFLFCHAEGKDTIMRFFNNRLLLKSRLLETDALWWWWKDDGGHVPRSSVMLANFADVMGQPRSRGATAGRVDC
ncbi:uncharacterized protein BXZ73DRAFT_99208 [Epithele typhae]|uniref:uncharacterized protein n=1 Tax=Epithele typhae TaxID=378194 RepID=UPI002008E614|nr:uncharacterized protein BXZ73DRAFT_99208 [Epithele typhae]KAH9940213.1 hypothetical protein BXZ73DRAFT_99208 [Epithele typhae]